MITNKDALKALDYMCSLCEIRETCRKHEVNKCKTYRTVESELKTFAVIGREVVKRHLEMEGKNHADGRN